MELNALEGKFFLTDRSSPLVSTPFIRWLRKNYDSDNQGTTSSTPAAALLLTSFLSSIVAYFAFSLPPSLQMSLSADWCSPHNVKLSPAVQSDVRDSHGRIRLLKLSRDLAKRACQSATHPCNCYYFYSLSTHPPTRVLLLLLLLTHPCNCYYNIHKLVKDRTKALSVNVTPSSTCRL